LELAGARNSHNFRSADLKELDRLQETMTIQRENSENMAWAELPFFVFSVHPKTFDNESGVFIL
jgi:hypothetical protein